MTKNEFVKNLKIAGVTDAEGTYEIFMKLIAETLLAGDEVSLNGIGKLKIKDKPARDGRNPKTGATIPIPAQKVVKFSVAKSLKEAVK